MLKKLQHLFWAGGNLRSNLLNAVGFYLFYAELCVCLLSRWAVNWLSLLWDVVEWASWPARDGAVAKFVVANEVYPYYDFREKHGFNETTWFNPRTKITFPPSKFQPFRKRAKKWNSTKKPWFKRQTNLGLPIRKHSSEEKPKWTRGQPPTQLFTNGKQEHKSFFRKVSAWKYQGQEPTIKPKRK